jgi:itaconate CoA-transferase
VQRDHEWVRFCTDVLRRPDIAVDERFRSNPLRARHQEALTAIIESVFMQLASAEVRRRLETAGIASAPVNSLEDYLHHPQLEATGSWREVDSPGGPVKALRPPARLDGFEPAMGPVPAVGQHSEAVLEELGFERDTIQQWKQSGVI